MLVKKLLVLATGVAVMGTTVVMAGGPDRMTAPPVQSTFESSIYLDGHLGYDQSNWSDDNANDLIGNVATAAYSPTKQGKGGLTGGLDWGYNFTQHTALEAGWFYLPSVTAAVTAAGVSAGATAGTSATVKSWVLYAAAKLSVSIMNNLDLFGKIGVGYRSLKYSGVTGSALIAVAGNGHYWLPLFATGLEYTVDSWLLGAQYSYITGNTAVNHANTSYGAPNAAPSANLYTAFLGYKFNV